MSKTLRFKKGAYKKVNLRVKTDLTGKTLQWRIKERKEDETEPLYEGNVIVTSTSETLSNAYFEVNLGATPNLEGAAYLDLKLFNNNSPSKPVYSTIKQIYIETTLKV